MKSKYTISEITEAVKHNQTIAGVLRSLNLRISGSSYKVIQKNISELSLDTSHWKGQAYDRVGIRCEPLKNILVQNSHYRGYLRIRLLREGLLRNECSVCLCPPTWQGKPLTLQLDHINGINTDNRIENLRIICPNCHSQTSTFGTKNIKRYGKPLHKNFCEFCKVEVYPGNIRCHPCAARATVKIKWPSVEYLLERLKTTTFTALGKELGVRDNTIRKHLRNRQKEKLVGDVRIELTTSTV